MKHTYIIFLEFNECNQFCPMKRIILRTLFAASVGRKPSVKIENKPLQSSDDVWFSLSKRLSNVCRVILTVSIAILVVLRRVLLQDTICQLYKRMVVACLMARYYCTIGFQQLFKFGIFHGPVGGSEGQSVRPRMTFIKSSTVSSCSVAISCFRYSSYTCWVCDFPLGASEILSSRLLEPLLSGVGPTRNCGVCVLGGVVDILMVTWNMRKQPLRIRVIYESVWIINQNPKSILL